MTMPESGRQPNGNIEIHPAEGQELLFVIDTQWRVASGYTFEFTQDGNLEIRNPSGELLWQTETKERGARRLTLSDGDLAISAADRSNPLWRTNTPGHVGAFIAFQKDGNLVIYTAERQPVWASNTNSQ